ncbi:MSHA biogenesis protein MshA [Vibrio diabolicus]|uniref:type II secretion system protein n=1 Tax=Vibrio TaxID=662 RepID=UPI000CE96F9A|nr:MULTISPECIES: type II secretion system protein [Vibrio]AVF96234.1 MSHA biogenesis protein MshA [Vibrio diabolicus]EGQ9180204.1 type II secretion system protein [Vibrio alginolyticus]ELB2780192.1 type II secretion system protein [Vibrio alginolyticus]MBS9925077.1 type II secretion system protein [Vibrio alginolyticus]MCA2485413.1 type II secretion system GspH family protein [Vibrio alginolyticus]
MKRQGGFTLIELVVVIVILGILAVTAAPRFLNLQSDARQSSLQGLKGAMTGASGIAYGKAAIEGVETEKYDSTTNKYPTLDDGTEIHVGYPAPNADGIIALVDGLETGTEGDWSVYVDEANSTVFATFQTGEDLTAAPSKCYVSYALDKSDADAVPVYKVNKDC